MREGYRTGRGRVVIRARTHVEDIDKGERQAIIVDELPYQVNKANLLIRIGELVREKKLEGISDLRDESDKSGMRVVIELKRGEIAEIVLNNLYKLTQLQDSFGMNMVALVDGQPRLLNLKQFLESFLQHRREVVTRRTRFELRKARERGHILEGLAVALSNVDEIIALIKAAPTPAEAKAELMAKTWRSPLVEEMLERAAADAARPEGLPLEFGWQERGSGYRLSDAQAQAILELRLQRLTGLEQDKILDEYKEVMAQIVDLLDILAKPARITAIIGDELTGDPRAVRRRAPLARSSPQGVDLSIEDLIAPAGHGGHAVARRLHEGAAARRVPRAEARRPRQAGDRRPRKTISSSACSSPTRTTTSCASPTAGACTGSRSTKCRRAAAPRAASRSSTWCRSRRTRRSPRSCRSRSSTTTHFVFMATAHGHGQEDAAVRFLAAAAVGHHRGRPGRRRLPDRRRAHRRQARRDAVPPAARRCASTRTTCARWAATRTACAA